MIKGNIEDVLKQKLDNIQHNRYIDESILEEKSKLNLKLVASFILVCVIVSFTVIFSVNHIKKEDIEEFKVKENESISIENANNDILEEKNVIELPKLPENLVVGDAGGAFYGYVEDVLVVKIDEIAESTCYTKFKNRYSYVITQINATVLKKLKGEYNEEKISFYVYGGTVKISEYENILMDEEKEFYGFNNMTQEEKENTYVYSYPTFVRNQPTPIKDETYIISINLDKNIYNQYRILPNVECNFKLYDLKTNKFKNSDSIWQEVEEKDFDIIPQVEKDMYSKFEYAD